VPGRSYRHHRAGHNVQISGPSIKFLIDNVRITTAAELVELDELQQAFREKALVDRDTTAGVLMAKIAERRATLLGLNPPIGHAVAVLQHEPPAKMTTTQEIGALIDEIMGIESKPGSEEIHWAC